jgi:hypothetical protein
MEEKGVPEKTIVIDIKLTRGLVVALSCALVVVGLLAYLTLTGKRAAASETGTSGEASLAQSTGMRQFYLTPGIGVQGNQARTACAAGYHMASIWELAAPSNLKYNTSLGANWDDNGQGPPTNHYGWVRTGYTASSTGGAGVANCDAWNSTSGTGTYVWLHALWTDTSALGEDVGVWSTDLDSCASVRPVWCIED